MDTDRAEFAEDWIFIEKSKLRTDWESVEAAFEMSINNLKAR